MAMAAGFIIQAMTPQSSDRAHIEYRASLWRAINTFSIDMLEATEKYKKAISKKRKLQPLSSIDAISRKKQKTMTLKDNVADTQNQMNQKPKCPYKRILCQWTSTSPIKPKPKPKKIDHEPDECDGDILIKQKPTNIDQEPDKLDRNAAENEMHSKMKHIVNKLSDKKLCSVIDNALKIWKICCKKKLIRRYDAEFLPSILLYIACRQMEPDPLPFLINDFAKVCNINNQKLASKAHKLCKDIPIKMNVRPDAIMYVTRFANMLRFGDETEAIIAIAMKVIARIKSGRPGGVYAAALVLASRIHGRGLHTRSVQEVAKLVHISENMIKTRVKELSTAKIALMTVQKFVSLKK